MFDLPSVTPEERKEYVIFRKMLLGEGFTMMQYSVYVRFFGSEEAAKPIRKIIKKNLPPDGHVRLLAVTDKQFSMIEVFHGKTRVSTEEKPEQLVLF